MNTLLLFWSLTATERLTFRVDHRAELLTIIHRLAGNQECGEPAPKKYAAEVKAHFLPYLNHPAVLASKQLRKSHGISFNAPVSLAVNLTDGFELRAPSPDMDARWEPAPTQAYLAKVRDFAAKSNAKQFFDAHAAYYAAVAKRFSDALEKEQVVEWFDGFFGARAGASYVVVPGLLNGGCNFGEQSKSELYQFVCVDRLDEQELPRPSEETVALLVHEMAHSYINPLFAKHEAALEPAFSKLYSMVAKKMEEHAYPQWQIVANESGVRAATIEFLRARKGARSPAEQIHMDEGTGFVWIAGLAATFAEYTKERSKYPTFEAFLPRVIAFADGVARDYAANGLPKLAFSGPINRVFDDDVIFALSSDVPSLSSFVRALHARPKFAKTELLVGSSKWANVTNKGVILYGSPMSDPALARALKQRGVSVTNSGISIAGRRFSGDHLVAIVSFPHPANAGLGVVAYTATNPDDLVDINATFHGPTDWVVARKEGNKHLVLDSGNFE